MAQKDSQEKVLQFRLLEARLEGLIRHRELVANRLAEIEGTIAGIDEIDKSKGSVAFHVGTGAFVPAKPATDENIIVTIGADVAVEKTVPNAKKLLETMMKEANEALNEVQKEIEALTKMLEEMVPEIEAAHGH